MINVSSEFLELMNERTDFKENAVITFTDGTVLNLSEDDFTVSNNNVVDGADSGSIPLGAAISRNIQIELLNDDEHLSEYDFFGAKIRHYLTFQLDEEKPFVGRNLIANSAEISVTRNIITNNWISDKVPIFKNTDYGFAQIHSGGEFTLSFDYAITGITTACNIYAGLKHTSTQYTGINKTIALSIGDNLGRFEHTFIPTEGQMQYGTDWFLSGFGPGKNQSVVITLKNIKLEKGNIATDWSIAPEDIRTEKIEYGVFTVTIPETYGTTVLISASDDMYKADRAYSTNISFPATAKAVLIDSCKTCNIPLLSTSFLNDNFIIQTKPSGGYTHRQIIGYIAMIACGNARINRQGYLEILSYNFDFETQPYHNLSEWINLTFDTSDITITGVQTTYSRDKTVIDDEGNESTETEDVTILEGTEGYVISIENPLISGKEQTVVSLIADRLNDVTFRKFEGDYIAYPIAEFMDLAKFTDWKGNTYNTFLTDVNFTFFGFTTMKNSAESGLRMGSTYPNDTSKALVKTRELVEKEKTYRELAVQKLQQSLLESSGLYSTSEEQSDKSYIYYLHDKPTLQESKNVIKLTAEAIGFSTDGGKTYPYGFTITGEMITKLLYAEGINADYIDTGAITVRDASDNIIFSVDMDTRQVYMNGDYVQIGGKPLSDVLEDVKKDTTSLSMILDNEYQGIPVDADGHYIAFPTVRTIATVYYGHTDISADCSYSIAKSEGVTGSFDIPSRTYTVKALTADSGWVDITATYLNLFTVTKRFIISKIRDGAEGPEGPSGRSYSLLSSASIIKRQTDGTMLPGFIDFEAYYYDGNIRQEYAGRYVIEETEDGVNWTQKYISNKDETGIRYNLYAALVDANGHYISDTNGNFIAIQRLSKNAIAVRCSLYASGATTTMIDQQTVSIVSDAKQYTSEEIFNLLTDNGIVQGIYKVGNQIFINGEYIKANTILASALANNSITEEKILNGSVSAVKIADGAVTASKISVQDLYALGATIAGWNINKSAIYKDIEIGNIIYRVYFQPPNTTSGVNTWILSCQYKEKNSTDTFKHKFILFADGSAWFGGGKIKLNADGSVSFGDGKTQILLDGTIQSKDSNENIFKFKDGKLYVEYANASYLYGTEIGADAAQFPDIFVDTLHVRKIEYIN